MYIKFSENNFKTNKEINNYTVLDIDDKNKIIGIELLEVSKRMKNKSFEELNVEI